MCTMSLQKRWLYVLNTIVVCINYVVLYTRQQQRVT